MYSCWERVREYAAQRWGGEKSVGFKDVGENWEEAGEETP